ncbi:MAG: hypothetical protein AAFN40_23070 [Cyanobacteria bacterium J06560_6]
MLTGSSPVGQTNWKVLLHGRQLVALMWIILIRHEIMSFIVLIG